MASAEIFGSGIFEGAKVLLVALLMYVIIFAILEKIQVLGTDKKINSLVALLSAIIVSFSGLVTYAITYAINWFVIVLFVIFLMMFLMMFLGVNSSNIAEQASKKPVIIGIGVVFFLLLLFVFAQGYLSSQADSSESEETNIIDSIIDFFSFASIDNDLFAAFLFLLVIGIVVIFIGRGTS